MKRSQTALEFLTTYGWAILIVTIMIGALAYYGVINPKNLIQERCISSPEFQCMDHVLYSNGTFNLILRVNVPEGVKDVAVYCDDGNGHTASASSTDVVNNDEKILITCDLEDAQYIPKDVQKINVELNYTKVGGAFPHTIFIETINKVIKADNSNSGSGGGHIAENKR